MGGELMSGIKTGRPESAPVMVLPAPRFMGTATPAEVLSAASARHPVASPTTAAALPTIAWRRVINPDPLEGAVNLKTFGPVVVFVEGKRGEANFQSCALQQDDGLRRWWQILTSRFARWR
jgi:hypothetical protein